MRRFFRKNASVSMLCCVLGAFSGSSRGSVPCIQLGSKIEFFHPSMETRLSQFLSSAWDERVCLWASSSSYTLIDDARRGFVITECGGAAGGRFRFNCFHQDCFVGLYTGLHIRYDSIVVHPYDFRGIHTELLARRNFGFELNVSRWAHLDVNLYDYFAGVGNRDWNTQKFWPYFKVFAGIGDRDRSIAWSYLNVAWKLSLDGLPLLRWSRVKPFVSGALFRGAAIRDEGDDECPENQVGFAIGAKWVVRDRLAIECQYNHDHAGEQHPFKVSIQIDSLEGGTAKGYAKAKFTGMPDNYMPRCIKDFIDLYGTSDFQNASAPPPDDIRSIAKIVTPFLSNQTRLSEAEKQMVVTTFVKHAEHAGEAFSTASLNDRAKLKLCFNRVSLRLHPDKLLQQGRTPEEVEEATERFKELRGCYDILEHMIEVEKLP